MAQIKQTELTISCSAAARMFRKTEAIGLSDHALVSRHVTRASASNAYVNTQARVWVDSVSALCLQTV